MKCFVSLDTSSYSKRCFITGEWCSKQLDVKRRRDALHEESKISAFVVMNYSNMSDVIYEWRLKPLIKSLRDYLYFNRDEAKLYCTTERKADLEGCQNVNDIDIIRADSNPSNNFVICNRVCKEMQIADLVVVDVSMANANVFYELGMAVALGKLILPICYSESFYHRECPEKLKKVLDDYAQKRLDLEMSGNHKTKKKRNKQSNDSIIEHIKEKEDELKRHIGWFPWRKELFEYFGIRFRQNNSNNPTNEYLEYDKATDPRYGFSDEQYLCFPYDAEVQNLGNADGQKIKIGKAVYDKLKGSYKEGKEYNTLVVYTTDGILNQDEVAKCIINYNACVVEQFKNEQCFCGDRVGVLIQGTPIPEADRDAPSERQVIYSSGDIIQIGMNQATYSANQYTIKPKDYLNVSRLDSGESTVKELKEYLGNRAIPIYPSAPVYVNRVTSGLQTDILDDPAVASESSEAKTFFSLYNVMLRTLRYTDEIAVDISNNSVYSLFWLGVAHGAGVNAITIRHEESEAERKARKASSDKVARNIFDVAGLWTAVSRTDDTEGFYQQLELAQFGIEQRTKLMLDDVETISQELMKGFWDADSKAQESEINEQQKRKITEITETISKELIKGFRDTQQSEVRMPDNIETISQELLKGFWDTYPEVKKNTIIHMEKAEREKEKLESYYRDRFWLPMLRYNRLKIYLAQKDDKDDKKSDYGEPRANASKWDVDAIAELSHYLTKRKNIGEYQFEFLRDNIPAKDAVRFVNFICVGQNTKPFAIGNATCSLARYINMHNKKSKQDAVREGYEKKEPERPKCSKNEQVLIKGFCYNNDASNKKSFCTQLSRFACYNCQKGPEVDNQDGLYHLEYLGEDTSPCILETTNQLKHTQIAQLLLWRDRPQRSEDNQVHYWVAMNGASGPATKALVSLFVDKKQKEDILTEQRQEGRLTPLYELQEELRKQVIKEFLENAKEIDEKWVDTAKLYLSSVLYRYFLPFLSLEDENRIVNGMTACLAKLRNSGAETGDANHKTTIEHIVDELKKMLHSLRGVEALYRVKVDVKHDPDNNEAVDERRILSIELLENCNEKQVNCLYLSADSEKAEVPSGS